MCIKILVQYACGHAEVEFMNRHYECKLIVGPVVERRGRCRRVCGGEDEVGLKVEVENERERDGVRSDEGGGKGEAM
jgi:hypothetical protein